MRQAYIQYLYNLTTDHGQTGFSRGNCQRSRDRRERCRPPSPGRVAGRDRPRDAHVVEPGARRRTLSPRRAMTVAVVGTGIAGLGAAYALSSGPGVELFEAADAPGGHVRTVPVGAASVDTGFIVYNEVNYPLLTRLFDDLGIPTRPTEMSFSCECACGLAWSSRRPWRAGRLLGEILRFLRTAGRADVTGKTLAEFLDDEGYSQSFRWHYLVPDDVRALVDGNRRRTRGPGRDGHRVLSHARAARTQTETLAHRGRRQPDLRRRAAPRTSTPRFTWGCPCRPSAACRPTSS